MESNSVTLHRVLKADPEKVYRAFTDAKAYSAWLPPYGYVAEVQQMDARVGGSYKMSFTNFSTGNIQSSAPWLRWIGRPVSRCGLAIASSIG